MSPNSSTRSASGPAGFTSAGLARRPATGSSRPSWPGVTRPKPAGTDVLEHAGPAQPPDDGLRRETETPLRGGRGRNKVPTPKWKNKKQKKKSWQKSIRLRKMRCCSLKMTRAMSLTGYYTGSRTLTKSIVTDRLMMVSGGRPKRREGVADANLQSPKTNDHYCCNQNSPGSHRGSPKGRIRLVLLPSVPARLDRVQPPKLLAGLPSPPELPDRVLARGSARRQCPAVLSA